MNFLMDNERNYEEGKYERKGRRNETNAMMALVVAWCAVIAIVCGREHEN